MRADFSSHNNGVRKEVVISFPTFFKCWKTSIGNSLSGENILQEWGRNKDIFRWKNIENVLIIYFIHEQFKSLLNYFVLIISTKSINTVFSVFRASKMGNTCFFLHFNKFLLCVVLFWIVSMQVVIMDCWFVIIWLIHERCKLFLQICQDCQSKANENNWKCYHFRMPGNPWTKCEAGQGPPCHCSFLHGCKDLINCW